jgi:hypothetical protein
LVLGFSCATCDTSNSIHSQQHIVIKIINNTLLYHYFCNHQATTISHQRVKPTTKRRSPLSPCSIIKIELLTLPFLQAVSSLQTATNCLMESRLTMMSRKTGKVNARWSRIPCKDWTGQTPKLLHPPSLDSVTPPMISHNENDGSSLALFIDALEAVQGMRELTSKVGIPVVEQQKKL